MKTFSFITLLIIQLFIQTESDTIMKNNKDIQSKSLYDIEIYALSGEKIELSQFKGKKILFVMLHLNVDLHLNMRTYKNSTKSTMINLFL